MSIEKYDPSAHKYDMALDPRIERLISTQIAQQFPDFYREHGPVFVDFVRTYYEWMESDGQVLYHSRRHLDYKDVDTTTDAFLVHFKEKYLSGIQLGTESSVRQLIKHSLDLYRTKGTERSIDLLFRLVFGTGAEVYFPSKDIFRLSDGVWVKPTYLEVSNAFNVNELIGKQVEGVTSGAQAFVERVVRKRTANRYVDVLYITDVFGDFTPGEPVNRSTDPLHMSRCPKVVGSLTHLEVTAGGYGYAVGDLVDIYHSKGFGGKARVSSVLESSDTVTFELLDGGYGYSINAQILISDQVLLASNLSGTTGEFFTLFETLTQQEAAITYQGANGTFAAGDQLFTYHANTSQKGYGLVQTSSETSAGAGEIYITVMSGDMDTGPYYTTANAVTANLSPGGYTLSTVTGNVMALGYGSMTLVNRTGAFTAGERILPSGISYGDGRDPSAILIEQNDETLTIDLVKGKFTLGETVYGELSNATGEIDLIEIPVGVIVPSAQSFSSGLYSYATGNNAGTFRIRTASVGSGANVVVRSIAQTEFLAIADDYVADYANVMLDALAYGFPIFPTANQMNIINDCLTYSNVEVGEVASIRITGFGTDYTQAPLVRIWEPFTYDWGKTGWKMFLSGAPSEVFQVDEIVTQSATGARGKVIEANTSYVFLRRFSAEDEFVVTANSTTVITGATTGYTSNVTAVWDADYDPMARGVMGYDTFITANASFVEGVVEELVVVDSGYGYTASNMQVSFFRDIDDLSDPGGLADATANAQGFSTGYYKTKGGWLSSSKKLFDGDYYQEYSYEVRSPLTLDKYKDMLKRVLHLAGTKMFGAMISSSELDVQVSANSSVTIG